MTSIVNKILVKLEQHALAEQQLFGKPELDRHTIELAADRAGLSPKIAKSIQLAEFVRLIEGIIERKKHEPD
jgi:hypothetical protein